MSTSHLNHQQNEKLAGCICATGAVKLYWFMKVLNALFTISHSVPTKRGIMPKQQVQLGIQQYVIILLTIATALVHFTLLFPDTVFILNGLGYLALVAALYLPLAQLAPYRNQIRWALMAYTAITIVLWIFMGGRVIIAYVDKLIEIILLVLLWLESQKAS